MSQLHVNILKILQEKKNLKISVAKTRKLKDALKKLHEETTGCGQESVGYFAVPLQQQQQETSSLTNAPVPHFLESVTKYILTHHATQEGLLRKNGNERRANSLKDLMEKNDATIPTGEFSVHDVTCVLKRWFRCLPEPVIPLVLHDIFAKCVELLSHHHRTQALLMTCLLLPTFHLNTLKHVAVFLKEIAKNDGCNKMTSGNLAKVLAPSLMPRIAKVETDPELAKKFSDLSTTAVQVLIDNADMIGVLAPEFEAFKTIMSEDDLSDHENGEKQSKKKLFTFLKSKGITSNRAAAVLRTPQLPSKRVASKKSMPQSCPPKMTKAIPKKNTPPPHKRHAISRAAVTKSGALLQKNFSSPPLQNEGESSPGKSVNSRAARRLSVERPVATTEMNDERTGTEEARLPRRRLHRNNASVRSLPAQSNSVITRQQKQRNSVRRSATVRAAMKEYNNTKPIIVRNTSSLRATARVQVRGSIAKNSPRKPPRTTRITETSRVTRSNSDRKPIHLTLEPVVVVQRIPTIKINGADEYEEVDIKVAAGESEVTGSLSLLSMIQNMPKIDSEQIDQELPKESNQTQREPPDAVDGIEPLEDFVLHTVNHEPPETPSTPLSNKPSTTSVTSTDIANSSGTCVDSDEDQSAANEEEDQFVDGEIFIKNLSARKASNTRSTCMSTPSSQTTSDGLSPNSRRESVIAIRTSRAGFVKNNVRQIENTFATPIGFGVRTRRQTPGPVAPLRLELNENPITPVNDKMGLDRNNVTRRPLTPANAKRNQRSGLAATFSEPMDI